MSGLTWISRLLLPAPGISVLSPKYISQLFPRFVSVPIISGR